MFFLLAIDPPTRIVLFFIISSVMTFGVPVPRSVKALILGIELH